MLSDKEILKNAPKEATHVAYTNWSDSHKYLMVEDNEIGCWYHWVDDNKYMVDFDLDVVYDSIRSIDDIKKIVELESQAEECGVHLEDLLAFVNVFDKDVDIPVLLGDLAEVKARLNGDL